MKMTYLVSLFAALFAGRCHAATIVQSFINNIRFASIENDEPLLFAAETGNQTAFLRLGRYSTADVGKTFTFTRQDLGVGNWNAVVKALQGEFGVRPGLATFWFNLEPSEQYSFTGDGIFPYFELNRIDITPNYLRDFSEGGFEYRTASFNARLHWFIPEPATWVFLLGSIPVIAFRRRRILCVTIHSAGQKYLLQSFAASARLAGA